MPVHHIIDMLALYGLSMLFIISFLILKTDILIKKMIGNSWTQSKKAALKGKGNGYPSDKGPPN